MFLMMSKGCAKIICPYLENNGNHIKCPQMVKHLSTMTKEECVEEQCKDFDECWNE